MEFVFLFNALKRKKWVIAFCVAIAVAAAYVLTINQKPEYKSVAQVATGFTTADEIKLDDKFNVPQIEAKFNNTIEGFKSPQVINLLSFDLLLHDLTKSPFTQLSEQKKNDPVFQQLRPKEAIAILNEKLYQLQPLNPDNPKEALLQKYLELYEYDPKSITENLDVSRVAKTDYINITYTSYHPELSAFAANNLVSEYGNYYNQNRRQRSDTSLVALDSLVKQRKKELDQKIAAKTNFMASKGILDVNMEGASKLDQINTLERQLTDEKGNKENLQYRIQELSRLIREASGGNTRTSGGTDNLDYVTLKNQYSQLYNEYVQKGSNDPALKARLDNIRKKMQTLQLSNAENSDGGSITYLDDLKQKKIDAEGQLKASVNKIASIQSALNQLNGNISGMATQGAGLEQLEREIQIASAEYTKAKERLNAVLNASEVNGNTFRQSLIALPALKPEPSRRPLEIILAGLCALVLSSIVVMFLEFLDPSIKTPSHFANQTDLRLLGVINYVDIKPDVLNDIAQFKGSGYKKRNDKFRELLRKVRYEIEHSGKKVFLFTSTEPGQGKTTLIQALAYSFSLVKKKVLIIDTNFCNNDLTNLLSAKPVLEKFHVNGKGFTYEDVEKLITKTNAEGVDMIGCEGGNYTPREILPQNHLLNYLPELSKVYDYIFMEGAPLNDFTDTKELIHYSDGVVAVFSSDTSLTATDKESMSFFNQYNEKFLGAVLNKVKSENLDL